jgi:transcriptional regulator with XRE-family HTH domain
MEVDVSQTPDNTSTESIGQRLRRLRTERGLSQRELSAPGVSYAYISRIEAGTRQPSVKALRKLARKLGVTPEYLETGYEVGAEERREVRLADAELELRLGGNRQTAEAKLRDVLADAVDAGDLAAATRARIALGSAAFDRGEAAETLTLLEEAVRDGGLAPVSRPDVFAQLGRAYAALGDTGRAVELFERCIAEIEAAEPRNAPAHVQFAIYLSHALSDAGELEAAQSVLSDALSGEALADPYTRIKLYWSLARVAGIRGDHSIALRHARHAIALLETTEDTVQLGRAHLLCAVILLRQGKAEEAGPQLERAERLMGPRPAPTDLAYLRTEQAKHALALGDGRQAVDRARQALDLLGDTDPAERGAAWLALAEGAVLTGEPPTAIDGFRRAVAALEDSGKHHESAEAYRAWARLLRQLGQESEALDALEKAAELGMRPVSSAPLRA